nr:translation initiation factor IF-2-like [Pongo pygmaeus]
MPRCSSGPGNVQRWPRRRLTWPRCRPSPGLPAALAAVGTQARSGACAETPAPGHTWKPGPAARGSPGSRRGDGGARAPGLPSRLWVAPGCGRCLELLTPAAWLPSASQSSNKRGRRRGEEEEPGGSAAPFTQQPKPGQAARAAPWGRPRRRGGGGSEGASLSETPSSSTQHALSAGRCGTTLPPPPFLGLRQCGSLVSLESPFRILVGAGRGRAPVRTPGCPLDRLGLLRLKRWEEFPAACGAKKKVLSSGAAVGGPQGPYRKSPYDPHGSTCPEAQATLSQRWGTDVLLQSQGALCLSLLFFLVGSAPISHWPNPTGSGRLRSPLVQSIQKRN